LLDQSHVGVQSSADDVIDGVHLVGDQSLDGL